MAVDIAKVYIQAEDQTGAAITSAQKGFGSLIDTVKTYRTQVAAIGAPVAAAGGLTLIVKDSIEARAALHDLGQETGLTVEYLSRIKPVAEIAGRSIEDVADTVAKFAKKVQEARNDSGSGAADLFKKLGIDTSQSRTADQIMAQTIQRLAEYKDSFGKTAGAQELFGKTGARNIPVLKDLSQATDMHARVTRVEAEEAERAQKNVRGLTESFRESRDELGGRFTPAVSAVTQTLLEMRLEGQKNSDHFKTLLGLPMKNWAAGVAIGFGVLVDAVRITAAGFKMFAVDALAVGRAAYAAGQMVTAGALAMTGNFGLAQDQFNRGMQGFDDASRAMRGAWDEFTEAVGDKSFTDRLVDNLIAAELRMQGFNTEVKKGEKDFPEWGNAGQAAIAKQISLIQKALELQRSQRDSELALQADLIQRKLKFQDYLHNAQIIGEEEYIKRKAALDEDLARTEIERARNNLAVQERILHLTESAPKPKNDAERVTQEIKVLEARDKVTKATEQLTIAERNLAQVSKDRGQALVVNDVKIRENLLAIQRDTEDYIRQLERQTEEMRFQNSLIGLSAEEQQKANVQHVLLNQYLDKRAQLMREIDDLARKQGDPAEIKKKWEEIFRLGRETSKAIEDQQAEVSEAFKRTWTNDLARSVADALVNGGKDAGPQLRKAVEDAFKNPIKVGIQAFMNQAIGGIMKMIPGGENFLSYMQTPQAGAAAMGGGLFGNFASRAAGAGPNGQQAATNYAATGAMIGMQTFGPIGAVVGAVIGAVAGYFTDPDGPAQRSAQFGPNPQGQYSFSTRDAFGKFGTFDDKWFSNSDMGQQMRQFMTALSQTDNALAALLRPGELPLVQQALSKPRTYDFGTEHEDFTATLTQITRDRMADMIDAVMPGLGKLIREADATAEELVNMAQALLQLRDVGKSIDEMILQISGSSVDQVKHSIDVLDTKVAKAQQDLDAAFNANDPTKILQAEQALTQAVMDRYNQEINMVRQLQQAIRQTEEEAYQFAISIAQRINSVGGSRNIGAIALNRATDLQGRILGDEPTGFKIEDVNSYVGAIDTWYQSERDRIMRDADAQAQAAQAISDAQRSAAQARLDALNDELNLAKSFQSLVDRTTSMINDMRLGSDNPAPATARLEMARQDVAALRKVYEGSSGEARIDAANKLLDALQRVRDLDSSVNDRPSAAHEQTYNEVMAELTRVQGDAKSAADMQVELQQRILEAQQQVQQSSSTTASAAQFANSQLGALDEQARGYYTWAEQHGLALYELQRQSYQDQLTAITGGMDVELFIASKQQEAVTLLQSIDARIAAWLAAMGADTGGAGGFAPAKPPARSRGSDEASSGGSVVINLPAGTSEADVVNAVVKNATRIRRAFANA